MKFVKETSELNKLALALMLYSTCGEDEETVRDTVVEEIGPGIFHITYNLRDPYDAMDFQVAIDAIRDTLGALSSFKYTVFRSVYGDDGEFYISID